MKRAEVIDEVELASKEGRSANLRGANLSGANLSDVRLSGADLLCVNLSGANLCGADLSGANLGHANLCGANLRNADLFGADLRGCQGVWSASVRWPGHGYCGRELLCVGIDGSPVLFCGCFRGGFEDLREYIKEGKSELAPSRLRALEIIEAFWNERTEL